MSKSCYAGILLGYRKIDREIRRLEVKLELAIYESSCFRGYYYDAMYFCDKVLSLKFLQGGLHCIKREVERSINALTTRAKKVLSLRILCRLSAEQAASRMGISVRSCTRMFADAIAEFSDYCAISKRLDELMATAYEGRDAVSTAER